MAKIGRKANVWVGNIPNGNNNQDMVIVNGKIMLRGANGKYLPPQNDSGVFKPRGKYSTYQLLTTDVETGVITPKVNDMYSIQKAGGNADDGSKILAGDHVVYVEIEDGVYGWNNVGGLTEYVDALTIQEIDSEWKCFVKSDKIVERLQNGEALVFTLYDGDDIYTSSEIVYNTTGLQVYFRNFNINSSTDGNIAVISDNAVSFTAIV